MITREEEHYLCQNICKACTARFADFKFSIEEVQDDYAGRGTPLPDFYRVKYEYTGKKKQSNKNAELAFLGITSFIDGYRQGVLMYGEGFNQT